MSTVDGLMVGQELDAFSDDYFVNVVLRSHIPYIRNAKLYSVVTVEPIDFYKYRGDFYGILDKNQIPKKYHSFILKFNDGVDTCTYEFTGNNSFYLPDLNYLDSIAVSYITESLSYM